MSRRLRRDGAAEFRDTGGESRAELDDEMVGWRLFEVAAAAVAADCECRDGRQLHEDGTDVEVVGIEREGGRAVQVGDLGDFNEAPIRRKKKEMEIGE
jgi:hypothetical protein